MINLHKDSRADFSDNDRYDDLDFTSGLREFVPPKRKPADWRAVAVLLFGALISQIVIFVLLALWKLGYCWSSHAVQCETIEAVEPLLILLYFALGPVCALAWSVSRVYAALMHDIAIARRTGLVLDRYGDSVPAALLERQSIQYYRERYAIATSLQRSIAPYQIYKGVNTLSSVRNECDTTDTPLLPDLMGKEDWKAAIDEMPHLLIYGPSKAGKSTLAQAVVAMNDAEYIVIDPLPNKPGERKWGGIDFITLQKGDDEFAPIRYALQAIQEEDTRRRQNLDTDVYRPLIIIIDEVLGLVTSLGSVKNDGKSEALMSRFIRLMGYSARHRNIKIILIGQGKNLVDLGLESATARNNYALIRASRNAATNERSAAILTDDGERAIDIREVLQLSQSISTRGQVWKTQQDMLSVEHTERALLTTLLTHETRDERAIALFRAGNSIQMVGKLLRAEGYTIATADLQRLKKDAL